jgi:hypothetical protein
MNLGGTASGKAFGRQIELSAPSDHILSHRPKSPYRMLEITEQILQVQRNAKADARGRDLAHAF